MRRLFERTRATRRVLLSAAVVGATWLLPTNLVRGEQRKFVVMLAYSPKAFLDGAGRPGLPPAGLPNINQYKKDYFDRSDPNTNSFAEYWEEVSYGAVTISGDVFGWVSLPWAFDPNAPSGGARPSPAEFIDLNQNVGTRCDGKVGNVPAPFAYGAGEEFCDCLSSGDSSTDISTAACGALIIIDDVGGGTGIPTRRAGFDDYPVSKLNVWTPGERFLDVDGDGRWDSIDEVSDMMCDSPDGCESACSKFVCSRSVPAITCRSKADCPFDEKCIPSPDASDRPCQSSGDCPTGERCGDPGGLGPRGCKVPGCGNLPMPCIDWTADGSCNNQSNCVIPILLPCTTNSQCPPRPGSVPPVGQCRTDIGACAPSNCVPPPRTGQQLQLPPCCDPEGNPPGCNNGQPGVTCGSPIFCCEFSDSNGNNAAEAPEPFEDFMVRWNPETGSFAGAWVRVDTNYIRNNYPGDAEALVARTGNGWYDSPDLFFDRGSTKMMQDASVQKFAWSVPKPGSGKYTAANEQAWFDDFWMDWYHTTPPAWPGGSGPSPEKNSPRMRPFDPAAPVPPIIRNSLNNRYFKPNRGGYGGNGDGTVADPQVRFSNGGDAFAFRIEPDTTYKYYDGWVEHDDLPSSKYHSGGDKRLGEITSPLTDTVELDSEVYTAIFGQDIGKHNPNERSGQDNLNVAAGPYATNVHGEKGYDAGDTCITEWLTWRTDGTSATPGYQWEIDNGFYHPFTGLASVDARKRCSNETDKFCTSNANCGAQTCTTRRCSKSGNYCRNDVDCGTGQTCRPEIEPFGFRDYNLDGMIDQGEVRPERSENYSVDSNLNTIDDGTHSDYPFNRRRMLEDIVAALDPSVDWDDFIDPNSMNAVFCHDPGTRSRTVSDPAHPVNEDMGESGPYSKRITAQGFVSGIVVVPVGSYRTDTVDLFPDKPDFKPIHNEDNRDGAYMYPDWPTDPLTSSSVHKSFNLWFHDLVICADCGQPEPTVITDAAREYGRVWEGFQELFDYDVFSLPAEINCPIADFDLMGRVRGEGVLVHFTPPLKNQGCTRWIDPVDLTTVLTPGVETRITLPPVEIAQDGYFYLDNEDRPGERYWFWSVGDIGSDRNLPSNPELGMLIMHFDSSGANPDALPLQQRSEPFSYYIVQADGRGDLEACESGGNLGDAGDIWPGTSNNRRFGFDTNPAARWYTQDSWTGLDITNIEPDGEGSTLLTLTWTPSNIPSLRFRQPPGGDSVQSDYAVRYQATDVHGGTTVRLYATPDPTKLTPGANGVLLIGSQKKTTPGTIETSQSWNLNAVPDGRYYLFAKLVPGAGANGKIERSATNPRASRNNAGDGTLTINSVDAGLDDATKARSEVWTVRLYNLETDGTQDWLVYSSLTQPAPQNDPPKTKKCTDARTGSDPLDPYPHLCLKPSANPQGVQYVSKGGEVRFTLKQCVASDPACPSDSLPFAVGDQFAFATTGITAVSAPVTVAGKKISAAPTAVIIAAPLSGSPPLKVDFDATDSTDPNGATLTYRWDFGDGSGFVTGPTPSHTYQRDGTFTVTLRATNAAQRSGETAVDIRVINNAPHAAFTASPLSGRVPLTVQFNASSSTDTEDDGGDLIYQWDFGDGTTANDAGLVGQFRQVSHVYSKRADGTACTPANPCTFIAKLTVTDTGGKKSSTNMTIRAGNSDPVARVVGSPLQGAAPLTVRFNASSSSDADGDALRVDWTWGDPDCPGRDPDLTNVDIKGNTSAQDGTVEHIYKCTGTFTPRVVVKDGKGGESTSAGIQVIVSQGGGTGGGGGTDTLVARFRITPNPPLLNQDFTVDAAGSAGNISAYSWNWGDGTPASTGVTTTHRYVAAGAYTIILTVSGPNNATAQTSQRVTVGDTGPVQPPDTNRAPTAIILASPTQGITGEEFRFDARRSSDPDGDALTYSWTFGDGATGTGPQTTHVYTVAKTYTVRLTVRDTENAFTQATQNVEVLGVGGNRPPVAIIATGPRTGTAPVALTFDGRNSYDLDGDAIAYLWQFQLGDGPIDDMDGQVVTKLFSAAGTYSVILTVTDSKNASTTTAPVEVRISAPVEPPDDGGGGGDGGGDGGGEERPIPDSADQRPTACGIGMVMALFGSLVGLSSLRTVRRRREGSSL